MDLETENRIASILLREAAELRRKAEKEGVRAYLDKPDIRHRPNSRFLKATVLGVQQCMPFSILSITYVFVLAISIGKLVSSYVLFFFKLYSM